MQNPPTPQFFVRARTLQFSRMRSASHTKCDYALCAQTNLTAIKIYDLNKIKRISAFKHLTTIKCLSTFQHLTKIRYFLMLEI